VPTIVKTTQILHVIGGYACNPWGIGYGLWPGTLRVFGRLISLCTPSGTARRSQMRLD
jgi:hypothetical protein